MKTICRKLKFLSLAFCVAIAVYVSFLSYKVIAATTDATTITIPNLDSLSNPYLIIYDIRTGYLVNAETGSVSVSTTWANAAFDEGHWTGGVVSAVTGWPNYIIPALSKDYNYGILVCDGASPACTDIVYRSGFYSAITGIPYTDSSPTYKGEVLVR